MNSIRATDEIKMWASKCDINMKCSKFDHYTAIM